MDKIHTDYDQLSRKIDVFGSSNFGQMVDGEKLATFSPRKFEENLKERGAMVNPSLLNDTQNKELSDMHTNTLEKRKEYTTIASTGLDQTKKEGLQDESRNLIENI